jgi:topoisomerase IV subunit B
LNSTHDWLTVVDAEHLADIRRRRAEFAAGGVMHLLLEVLAYAAEEAEVSTAGACVVTLLADGSVSVSDNGRGTQSRTGEDGRPVRKPVVASKDLRFFDGPAAVQLPDGRPRRGMSVVAALSEWLIHTSRRRDGGLSQRYRFGVPVTGLVPVESDGTTGTTVHFRPDAGLLEAGPVTPAAIRELAVWPHLSVRVVDVRDS